MMSAFSSPQRSRVSDLSTKIPTKNLSTQVSVGLKYILQPVDAQTCQSHDFGSCTNGDGQFIPKDGLILFNRYVCGRRIEGEGQSAVLIAAQDLFQSMALVAIKVMHSSYRSPGLKEVDTLRRLNCADPGQVSHTLRLLNAFMHGNHVCLVFPLFNPMPLNKVINGWKFYKEKKLNVIRKVTLHLLSALAFLKRNNTFHADVKPENVLVKEEHDARGENILDSVVLVDFGNAIHHTHSEVSLYYSDFDLQTLPYRAPEVCIGVPFGLEIDMWSLGCLLAELFLGKILFPGTTRSSVLKAMTKILGPLPEVMCKRGKFGSERDIMELPQTGISTKQTSPLDLMSKIPQLTDYSFASFLSGLICYCPDQRLTPWQALQHPFMSKEICIGHFLEDLSSPQCLVASTDYNFRQTISSDIKRMCPSTYDLLKTGTQNSTCASHVIKNVARVQPIERSTSSTNYKINLTLDKQLDSGNTIPSDEQVSPNTTYVMGDSKVMTFCGIQRKQSLRNETVSNTTLYNGQDRKVGLCLARKIGEDKTELAKGMVSDIRLPADGAVSDMKGGVEQDCFSSEQRRMKKCILSEFKRKKRKSENNVNTQPYEGNCMKNSYNNDIYKHKNAKNKTFTFIDNESQPVKFESWKQMKCNIEHNNTSSNRNGFGKVRARSADSMRDSHKFTHPGLDTTFTLGVSAMTTDCDKKERMPTRLIPDDRHIGAVISEHKQCGSINDIFVEKDNGMMGSVKKIKICKPGGNKRCYLNKAECKDFVRTTHSECLHRHNVNLHHLGSSERKRIRDDSSGNAKTTESTDVTGNDKTIKSQRKKRKIEDHITERDREHLNEESTDLKKLRNKSAVSEFSCLNDWHSDLDCDNNSTDYLNGVKAINGQKSNGARFKYKGVRRALQFGHVSRDFIKDNKCKRQNKMHEPFSYRLKKFKKQGCLSDRASRVMAGNAKEIEKHLSKRLLRESLLLNKSNENLSDPYEFTVTPNEKRKSNELQANNDMSQKHHRQSFQLSKNKLKARRSKVLIRDPYATNSISDLVEKKTKLLNVKSEPDVLSCDIDKNNCRKISTSNCISYPISRREHNNSVASCQTGRENGSDKRQTFGSDSIIHQRKSSGLVNEYGEKSKNCVSFRPSQVASGQKHFSISENHSEHAEKQPIHQIQCFVQKRKPPLDTSRDVDIKKYISQPSPVPVVKSNIGPEHTERIKALPYHDDVDDSDDDVILLV